MSDSSIKVAIKVRPLIKREKDENLPIQWTVQGNTIAPADPELRKRGDGGFQFDHIFNEDVNNQEVFNTIVKAIVDAGVNGFNGTVFAYGQTSSGKTYTMMGTPTEPGIIPLTIDYMFDAISNATGREFLLRVSYLEIYNEKVNDLLNKDAVDIKLHEDTSGQVLVKCKEEVTNSPENVLSIMKKGDKNRRIGETNMNDRSSRSHTIFRITIESREVGAASDGAIQVSQLNLVDLAGSERVRQTGATGERFKEGRNINQSLSTLGLVIKQLSESQDNQKFANFRDSKLTRLLRTSLGGNAMTTIICAVTPAALDETQCTLSFAARARNIKNKPQLNEVMSDAALLKRYAKQLAKLNEELEKLKQGNRLAEVEEMESKLMEKDRINQGLEHRIELLQTRIVSSSNSKHEESFKTKSARRRTWGGPSTFKTRMSMFPSSRESSRLHMIKEMSPEQCSKNSAAPIDIMNDSFQIAFTDFELELIESERDRDISRASDDASDSDEEMPTRLVKFKPGVDHISAYRPNYDDHLASPEPKVELNQVVNHRPRSPDTPKVVIRETLRSLQSNLVELAEFTTLEKQLYRQDSHGDQTQDHFCEVAKLKVELTMLRAEKNSFQNLIEELQKELNEVKKEKECITIGTSKSEKSTTESTGEGNCFEDEQTKIRSLKEEVDKLKTEKIKYDSISEELAVSNRKIDDLERMVSALTLEKDELQKSFSVQNEIALHDKLTKIEKLEEQIMNLTKVNTKSQKDANDSKEKLKELEILYESERKSHERKILGLEKLVDEYALRNSEFEQQKAAFFEKEAQLLEKCEEHAQSSNETMEKIITELRDKLEKVNRWSTSLEEGHVKETTDMPERIQAIESGKLECERNESALEGKLNSTNLHNKLDEAHRYNKTIKEKCEEVIEEYARKVQEEFERLRSEKLEYERVASALEEQLRDNKEASTESVDKQQGELCGEIEVSNSQAPIATEQTSKVLMLHERVESLLGVKAELECVVSNLRKQLEETNNLNIKYDAISNDLRKELEKANQRYDIAKEEQLNETLKLQEQMQNLQSEKLKYELTVSNLREQLEKLTCMNNDDANKTINDLCDKLVQEREQYDILKNEKETELSELEDVIKHLKLEKQQYEQIIEGLHEELRITKPKIKDLEIVISDLRCQLEEANQQNRILEEQLNHELKMQKGVQDLRSDECHEPVVNDLLSQQSKQGERENEEMEQVPTDKLSELESLTMASPTQQLKQEQTPVHFVENLENEHGNDASLFEENVHTSTPAIIKFNRMSILRNKLEESNDEKEQLKKKLIEIVVALRNHFESTASEDTFESSDTTRCKGCNILRKYVDDISRRIVDINKVPAEQHQSVDDDQEENTLPLRNQNELQNELKATVKSRQSTPNGMGKAEFHSRDHQSQNIDESISVKASKIVNCDVSSTVQHLSLDSIICDIIDEFKRYPSEDVPVENSRSQITEHDLFKKIQQILMKAILQLQEQPQYGQNANVNYDDLMRHDLDESLKLERKQSLSQKLEQSMIKQSLKLESKDEELEGTNLVNDENNKYTNVKSDMDYQSSFRNTSKDVDTSVIDELMSIKETLEEDNTKLSNNLELKMLELDEIKNDVQGLKDAIQQLEKTILLLTTENTEMSNKLTSERERMKEQANYYEERINELHTRVSTITEEKIELENKLTSLNELVDTLRSKTPEVNDDNIKQKFNEYQYKIDNLTTENIKLSQELAQGRTELEEIKQSKSLLYDHECIYKDKMDAIESENKALADENIQLSNSLIEKIEESDTMKEELMVLKSKIEMLMNTKMADNTVPSMESQLKAEIGELKAKMLVLTEENTRLSKNLFQSIDNLDNVDNLDNSRNMNSTFHLSLIFDDNKSDIAAFSPNDESTQQMDRATMQAENEHLRRLNEKLSHMKFTPCTQCAHLKEANESRREIKLQAIALTRKLENLQKKFVRESADAEVLMKVSKDFNRSFCDMSLNTSEWEALNVSLVEEKVRSLNKELETVQDDHNKLTYQYKEKCDEAEKLETSATVEPTDIVESNVESKTEKRLSKSVRMEKIECDVTDIRSSINDLKNKLENIRSISDTYVNERESLLNEINILKIDKEKLQEKILDYELKVTTATEKADILENEVADLTAKINQFNATEKQVQNEKLLLEVKLADLEAEKEKKESTLAGTVKKLETLSKQQMELLNSKDMMEHRHKDELNSALKKYQDSIMELEEKLKITEEKLDEFKTENGVLKKGAHKVHSVTQVLLGKEENCHKILEGYTEAEVIYILRNELNKARKRIIEEIATFQKPTTNLESSGKSAEELFAMFLQAVLQKQSEVTKAIQAAHEKATQKLEDQKKQSQDAEKKTRTWAKELENEIEKLQDDLAKQETVCSSLQNKCSQLEHVLKESTHENETLRKKMLSLETDFNNVQAELEMKSNGEIAKDVIVGDAEKHRRLAQEAFTGKELELQERMSSMKEEHEREIKGLSSIIETYKMKNMELKTTVDGLEENQNHLNNMVIMRSSELAKVTREMNNLMEEWEQLSAAHTESCRDLESKNAQLSELSADLDSKCNLLSEYKMKVDTVMPEYETLKEQTKKRMLNLERYKKELKTLKAETEAEKALMQEKLFTAELESAEAKKSMITLTSKNEALLSEINNLYKKNDELAQALAKLERKIRNSTSKQKAETKIQELEDHIKTLQCNLDGATNRIQDLQESKNQLLKKFGDLEGQYDVSSQENAELKKTLSNIIELQGKYHETVQVKNQIALELEGSKLLLIQRDKEMKKYENQIKILEQKNLELDAELEEMAQVIREKDGENAVLEDKLNTALHKNVELEDIYNAVNAAKAGLENQIRVVLEENRAYKADLANLCNNTKDVDMRRQNEQLKRNVAQLRKQNAELLRKVTDLESSVELRSVSSRRQSDSPSFQNNRRRQSRGDAFNERRHLNDCLDEENETVANSIDILRRKIRELEHEIVCKNGKLATLEMQIQSENFPYEKKCEELKELNRAYDNKNKELRSKIRKLERALNDVSRSECDECRRRSTNRSNQSVQTMPDKMHCSSTCNSGMEDKEKKKLIHQNNVWKDLCRSRDRQLKELQEKLRKLQSNEDPQIPEEVQPLRDYNILRQTSSSSLFAEKETMDFDKKMKQAMKENMPTNIVDGTLTSNCRRRPWNVRP